MTSQQGEIGNFHTPDSVVITIFDENQSNQSHGNMMEIYMDFSMIYWYNRSDTRNLLPKLSPNIDHVGATTHVKCLKMK